MKKLYTYEKIVITAASAVLLAFASCLPAQSAGNNLIIKGSTTVLPIAQIAAEEFMDKNPKTTISVQGGGSGVGIASLIDKTADIADSSRKMKAGEIAKAKASGVNPYENVIAVDGIAVVVHPSNPVNNLTREQIKAIYTGKISSWSELGGKKAKIVVVSRDTSSGTFESFYELALDKEKVRPDALTTASNQAGAQIVGQTPGAIAYVGLGYITPKVKAIEVNGIKCTEQNILNDKYPLSRPLFMYTDGVPAGSVKRFIDFVKGEEGRTLIREAGFIPPKGKK